MNDFIFQSPTRFVFGRGFVDRVGEEVRGLGARRALLVYGGGSAARSGALDRVRASLAAAGVDFDELGGVRPNPEVSLVREGIELARAQGVDLVLALGGGSVIDSSKAIAFGVPYQGDVWDFFCGKAKVGACLPVAVALTIPAAGSEGSPSCVISNDELQVKKGTSSDALRPRVAVMDPELTFGLPPYQTAAGVTDMICHVCERLFSNAGPVPVTDNVAHGIIRAIMGAARVVHGRPDDYDARATLMWAGSLAHNDLCGCGRGPAAGRRAGGWESHGLEHEISAHHPEVAHGAGLAVILPTWMRFAWRSNPQPFLSFARGVFGIEPDDDSDAARERAVLAGIDALEDFLAQLGMPRTLGELGLSPSNVDAWVRTLAQNKGPVFGEVRPLDMDDARAIYLSAF